MKNLTIQTLGLVCTVLFCVTNSSAVIETITFEAEGLAMGEKAFLPTVTVGSTTVTLSVLGNANSGPLPAGRAPRIAKMGPGPILGFQNRVDGPDTPDPTSPLIDNGIYFITNGGKSPQNLGDYGMSFSQAVNNVSLLLYDYRADGNTGDGNPGVDSVTLVGFDAGMSAVDSVTWVVPDPRPVDGNVVLLALNPSTSVRSIKVEFGGFDFGTGVDNLSFQVVPEPAMGVSLLAGLAVLLNSRRRRSRC